MPFAPLRAQALVEDALVGRVLIHEQQPVGPLDQEIGRVELSVQDEIREMQPLRTLALLRGERDGAGFERGVGQHPIRGLRGRPRGHRVRSGVLRQRRPRFRASRRRRCVGTRLPAPPQPRAVLEGTSHGEGDESVDGARIAKSHLPFRRVHVHVDVAVWHREKQHGARKTPLGQDVAVHLEEGVAQQTIANGAAIHEEIEPLSPRAVRVRSRAKTLDRVAVLRVTRCRGGRHFHHRLTVAARQYSGHAIPTLCNRGPGGGGPTVAGDIEVNVGPRERGACQPIDDVSPFRRRLLQELAARGDRPEEVGDIDPCPLCDRGRIAHFAASVPDRQGDTLPGAARAGQEGELRNRSDRGKRLAAESKGCDRFEVFGCNELARRVALEGKVRLLRGHPRSVVANRDAVEPAAENLDADPLGPGIEGVFDELLDHRSGTLDHLARGDLIDDRASQPLDRSRITPRARLRRIPVDL